MRKGCLSDIKLSKLFDMIGRDGAVRKREHISECGRCFNEFEKIKKMCSYLSDLKNVNPPLDEEFSKRLLELCKEEANSKLNFVKYLKFVPVAAAILIAIGATSLFFSMRNGSDVVNNTVAKKVEDAVEIVANDSFSRDEIIQLLRDNEVNYSEVSSSEITGTASAETFHQLRGFISDAPDESFVDPDGVELVGSSNNGSVEVKDVKFRIKIK